MSDVRGAAGLPGVRIPAHLRRWLADDSTRMERFQQTLERVWALPKVELHIHLDGSMRPGTISELARRYEPSSPLCRDGWEDNFFSFRNLGEFVSRFSVVGRTCIRTPDDVHRVARECFEDLAAQQVVYAETSFGTRTPGKLHYIPIRDVMDAVDQARRDVEARAPLRLGLIVGLTRQRQNEGDVDIGGLAVQVVHDASDAREAGVAMVGIDLHGDEFNQPSVDRFVPVFRLAAEAGFALRAHAGEASGPDTVRDSLDRLTAQRIGHGVRAIHDGALVRHLAERRVPLDVCPTSNLLTGAVASLDEHPAGALHRPASI